MKIEMGVGWVPDEEKPGGLRSANPGEYAAEIEQVRKALKDALHAFNSRSHGGRVGWEEEIYQRGCALLRDAR